jgi:hypothetical protein
MLLTAVVVGALLSRTQARDQANATVKPDGPRLIIESLAPASAYAVGSQSVTVVGTVRNVGRQASAAGAYTARIYALTGLDYTEGDTMPKVPALEPNGSATFRWRLMPSAPDSPLVASMALETPGQMPEARVAAIQHFSDPLPGEPAGFSKESTARAGHGTATIENATIRVRVFESDSNVPALLMSARTPTGWRRVGTTLPAAEVSSAEGGQRPWWEVFRAESMRASVTKGSATLTLTGGFGLRWRGTIILTVRNDSSVVDGRLLLAPLKPVRLMGVRFLPFYAGDGSFGATVAETLAPEAGDSPTAAVRWGTITVGTTWLDSTSSGEWKTVPLLSPEGADYHLLGAEWQPDGPPPALTQANLIEFRARLFALNPSGSVADARRVAPPARPTVNPASAH